MRLRSLILILLLAAAGAGSVMVALEAHKPPPVRVVAEPTLSARAIVPIADQYHPALFSIGKVEALDDATLTAPIAAEVMQINARAGDDFARNNPLIQMDLREIEQNTAARRAEIAELDSLIAANRRNRKTDESRLQSVRRLTELAAVDHRRNQELLRREVIAQSDVDASEKALLQQKLNLIALENQIADYESQLRQLAARREATQARLAQSELQLERAQIRAPFDGRVAEVITAQGARVGVGAPLISVFDPTRLRMRVAVPQRYADIIKSGDDVSLIIDRRAAPPLTLSLSGFNPQIKSGSSAVETFFNLPADSNRILGESVDVVLRLPRIAALSVPPEAVYDDSALYTIDDDSRARNIVCERLGITRRGDEIQTLLRCDGWRRGARIIANQIPNIVGGAKITVIAGQ